MGHSHGGGDVPPRVARLLRAVVIALGLLTLLGLIVLRPGGDFRDELRDLPSVGREVRSEVEAVDLVPCAGQDDVDTAVQVGCVAVTMGLASGPDAGRSTVIELPDTPTTPSFLVGDEVVLGYEPSAPEDLRYRYLDRQRKPVLLWLALFFAAAVIVLGRVRGLAALGGLVVTVAVLLWFVLPAILDGRSPVLVAVFGSAAIAFATLYLAHGLNHMTTVALLGTLSSLALTAILAQVFVGLAKLSGFASEESILINLATSELNAAGLVLAGVVIGALGALDDVTVTQASAIWELHDANPSLRPRDLYRSGLRIGRDHIASTVNTLLLAYAGASLPLLLFFVIAERPLLSVANEEVVATEIVRTLVGSIGLVASVPLTTWLAAVVVSVGTRRATAD